MLEVCLTQERNSQVVDSRLAARETLRFRALEAESACAARCSLGDLWLDIIAGRLIAVDWFCADRRCYLVVTREPPGTLPLIRRDREFLERCLLGESEKVIAMDYGVSVSTVATRLKVTLRRLGVRRGSSGVPVLLAIAMHASKGKTQLSEGRSTAFVFDQTPLSVASAELPTPRGPLTFAERDVLRLLIEGQSRTQIAAARSTSARTVANQMGSIFRKLGVSGRRSLLSSLLTCPDQHACLPPHLLVKAS